MTPAPTAAPTAALVQLLQLNLHCLHLCLALCHSMARGIAQLVELHLQPLGLARLRLDAGVHRLLGLADLHVQLAHLHRAV